MHHIVGGGINHAGQQQAAIRQLEALKNGISVRGEGWRGSAKTLQWYIKGMWALVIAPTDVQAGGSRP